MSVHLPLKSKIPPLFKDRHWPWRAYENNLECPSTQNVLAKVLGLDVNGGGFRLIGLEISSFSLGVVFTMSSDS